LANFFIPHNPLKKRHFAILAAFRLAGPGGLDCYIKIAMKMPDIARRLARRAGVTRAEGADSLDRAVHQILSNLRKGKPTPLPGLGCFTHGPDGQIVFQREGERKRG